MRAYSVRIKNSAKWVSQGAIDESFVVLAPDIVSAIMQADECLNLFVGRLRYQRHAEAENVRITEIQESHSHVLGSLAVNREEGDVSPMDCVREWADRAKR